LWLDTKVRKQGGKGECNQPWHRSPFCLFPEKGKGKKKPEKKKEK